MVVLTLVLLSLDFGRAHLDSSSLPEEGVSRPDMGLLLGEHSCHKGLYGTMGQDYPGPEGFGESFAVKYMVVLKVGPGIEHVEGVVEWKNKITSTRLPNNSTILYTQHASIDKEHQIRL